MAEIRSQARDVGIAPPPEWILDCQFVEENAAGLALGTLEADERVRINHHLSWCPMCAQLVHEMRKTVAYLPFISPQATPPASAKQSLIARIDAYRDPIPAQRSEPPKALLGPTTSTIEPKPVSAPSQTGASPRPTRMRRHFNWQLIAAPLAAVPLVVALAIVGGWALHTQSQLNRTADQAHHLETQNADLTDRLTLLNNVLGADRSRWFYLDAANSSIGGNAGGKLTVGVDQGSASLSVWNLPAAKDGYVVLLETKDGQTHRIGSFHVDGSGGAANVDLDTTTPLDQYRAVHVQAKSGSDLTMMSDSLQPQDVLWVDMESNLGAPGGGTEAIAKSH
jgi:hypothetical protein